MERMERFWSEVERRTHRPRPWPQISGYTLSRRTVHHRRTRGAWCCSAWLDEIAQGAASSLLWRNGPRQTRQRSSWMRAEAQPVRDSPRREPRSEPTTCGRGECCHQPSGDAFDGQVDSTAADFEREAPCICLVRHRDIEPYSRGAIARAARVEPHESDERSTPVPEVTPCAPKTPTPVLCPRVPRTDPLGWSLPSARQGSERRSCLSWWRGLLDLVATRSACVPVREPLVRAVRSSGERRGPFPSVSAGVGRSRRVES